MRFDPRTFRDALGRFATGIAVATTRDADSAPVGVTVNSVTSVSLSPPLVLFCLDRSANTAPLFQTAPAFALNILAEEQRQLSVRFASAHAPDRWNGLALQSLGSNSPVLPDCLASLDCQRYAVHDGGDHWIIVGRVTDLVTRPDGRPLLYWRGGYQAIG